MWKQTEYFWVAFCWPPPSSSSAGSSPSVSTKKPRSRGLFSSLFCCLCRDQPEPPPVNNNAPLLVEENGTVSKVCLPLSRWLHFNPVLTAVERSNLCYTGQGKKGCVLCHLPNINVVVFLDPGEATAASSEVKRLWKDLCGYRSGWDFGSQLF